MALTATATERVRLDIVKQLRLRDPQVRDGSMTTRLIADLKLGDTIHIQGHGDDRTQKVTSMQLDHEPIEAAVAKSTRALEEMAGDFLGEICPLRPWHRAGVQDPPDVLLEPTLSL